MKTVATLIGASALLSALAIGSTALAGPNVYSGSDAYNDRANSPSHRGFLPVVWHIPQPLVRHGIPTTFTSVAHFAFDRSRLTASGRAAVDGALSQVHGFNPGYGMGKRGFLRDVNAVGHTDSIGSRRYNQRLSERRARAVGNYLASSQGVAPEMISSSGAGELQPIASNRTRAGRAQNRRTEIHVNALIAP